MSFAKDWSAADIASRLSGSGKAKAKKTGRGWTVCCPAHQDRTPSLSLADGNDGVLYCFAGCQQADVRKAIEEKLGISKDYSKPAEQKPKRKHVEEEWNVCAYVPDDATITNDDFLHYEYGMPVRTWTYRDAEGRISGWVARYEHQDKDGKITKEVVPYAWCRKNATGMEELRQKAMLVPRPLYNLEQILNDDQAYILWVEGEKAADAALQMFDQWAVTTTQGGGRAIHMSDLKVLRGRNVIMMPDNDRGGFTAVAEMALKLEGKATLYYLSWPTRWPDGTVYQLEEKDDIHDHIERGWTKEKLQECVRQGHKLVERMGFLGVGLEIIHYDYETEKKFSR